MEDDHLDSTYRACCWETLMPWQILHSKLAEREYQAGVKVLDDVWQLMEEALDTSDPRQIEVYSKYNWCWGGEEFWGLGGVMESRIREWLAWKEDEKEEEGREFVIINYTNPDDLNMQSNATMEECEYFSGGDQLTVRKAAAAAEDDDDDEDEVPQRGSQLLRAARVANVKPYTYTVGYGGDQAEGGEAEAEDSDLHYDTGCFEHDELGTSRSLALYNRWGAAAAANVYWRNGMEEEEKEDEESDGTNLAATTKLGPALDVELCPVCLEQLRIERPPTGHGQQSLLLPCRHTFHIACLQPWLQRRYSSVTQPPCCPCCRAAIPPNLAEACDYHGHYEEYDEGDNHHEGHAADIMRLLAEVEAALHRFGFRS